MHDNDIFALEEVSPAREYKDRLFRMVFREKEKFLELYNAINGTAYDDPGALTVTTLENAIYLGMRNDVSYLLYDQLTLYEHQASINPNMPLRNLFYVADIYSNLTKDSNLYSSRLIPLPEPQFVVFYNGIHKLAERSVLQLADAFSCKSGKPKLNLEVLVLNINPGYNLELIAHCSTLRDYTIYVDKVRTYAKEMDFSDAVERAIQECIASGVLAEFLSRNRAEVKKVSIYEYDEEKHIRQEREEAMEDGIKIGLERGRTQRSLHLILTNKQKGFSAEAISDFLGESLDFVQTVFHLIDEHPSADADALIALLQAH